MGVALFFVQRDLVSLVVPSKKTPNFAKVRLSDGSISYEALFCCYFSLKGLR